MVRAHSRRTVLVVVVVATLAACSSHGKSHPSSSSTTKASVVPTTLPPPPTAAMIADVKAFMAGPGVTLLKFERATTSVATLVVPSKQTCIDYFTKVLPPIITGPNALVDLAQRVPDPALAQYFHNDIGTKDIILLACKEQSTVIPAKAMKVLVRQNGQLKQRLALYGITF